MESLSPWDIAALKREISSSLHCAMPGIVASFDAETQTACVQPVFHMSSRPERSGTEGSPYVPLPLIRDVPVFFPGSREGAVTWPVSAGDECLLVFADFDTDAWLESGESVEPVSARRHSLSDAFAFIGFRSQPNALRDFEDEPSFFGGGGGGGGDCYTRAETDALLSGKSDTGHDHDGRYYTESEADDLLAGKSDTGHRHAAGDITSGTFALTRGGTGQTGTGGIATAADIAAAETGVTISTAQYAYWGKVAMIRLAVKRSSAVSSGTTTLCTLNTGKRPKYNAMATCSAGNYAQILSTGKVQVTGAISAGVTMTIMSTFVLA